MQVITESLFLQDLRLAKDYINIVGEYNEDLELI